MSEEQEQKIETQPDNQKTNYQESSKKDQKPEDKRGRKKLEKVVVNEVIMPKESMGSKFKNTFFAGDLKSVGTWVFWAVMIPGAKKLISDAMWRGTDKMLWGEGSGRGYRDDRDGRVSQRISYDRMRDREYSDPRDRDRRTPDRELSRRSSHRAGRTDYLFRDQDDAEKVLEDLKNALEDYDDVSLGDFYELMGIPHTHVDNDWVWTNLRDTKIVETREGYFIDFPPLRPVNDR